MFAEIQFRVDEKSHGSFVSLFDRHLRYSKLPAKGKSSWSIQDDQDDLPVLYLCKHHSCLHVLLQTRFQTSFDLFGLGLIIHPARALSLQLDGTWPWKWDQPCKKSSFHLFSMAMGNQNGCRISQRLSWKNNIFIVGFGSDTMKAMKAFVFPEIESQAGPNHSQPDISWDRSEMFPIARFCQSWRLCFDWSHRKHWR